MIDNFVVFIISHGRPNDVYTLKSLKKHGYSGKYFLILDDTDKKADSYKRNFGEENIIIFNKEETAKKTDHADNFWNLRTTTHARNACFDIAKDLGYDYFLVLDDDYTSFDFSGDEHKNYNTRNRSIVDIDIIFKIFLEFLQNCKDNVYSIAFAQGGDFIGGEDCGVWKKQLSRKCMNSWFCKTDRYFKFFSRLNEDVNTYINLGKTGCLFFTARDIRLEQKATQKTKGGMTEAYLEGGTYVKSFYSIMIEPSFVKFSIMGNKINRIHHFIDWKKASPKIISEDHKKKSDV